MRLLTQQDALYPDQVKNSFFHEGQFLGITQAVQALEQCQDWGTPRMVDNYYQGRSYHQKMLEVYQALPPKQFPVVRLRHVTVEDRFMGILQDGEISGSTRTFLLKGVARPLRVSCWGVHIPPKKLEAYRKKRLAQFMQIATERGIMLDLSPKESAEVRHMLANSPAMREDSRYGNFQFSFSTKDLLAMYREQHCGGQKPVLRVLGTEAHKQELVHWFLIHSPDCGDFGHLPTVDPPGPFSRDGNLVWTPESLTNQFVYTISNSALCKTPRPHTNGAWIWNNAVFAFYLPEDSALRIDRRRLLENVEACETTQSQVAAARNNYLRHSPGCYISKESAQATIEDMKRQREGIKRQRKGMKRQREAMKRQREATKRQRNGNRTGPQPPSWDHPHFY